MKHQDSFHAKTTLNIHQKTFTYYSLPTLDQSFHSLSKLPFSLRVLLENLVRHEDGVRITKEDISALMHWPDQRTSNRDIPYFPARVLMQDFTGVPAIVDLAAMREAVKRVGRNPDVINPLTPVDLIIDHSVMVDQFASENAFQTNVRKEYERNHERYDFLRWGQKSFRNFRVVPPGTGICHQVNLEYLGKVVWVDDDQNMLYPDTLVGTDSHTTMINALSILGWGVGGIEAEAAMLGQPISMKIPEVIGFKFKGKLKEGATATDLVLTVTQLLREKGVVGKFVEFYGDGLSHLSLADRATIANMAPEYGATCGFFPIDEKTLDYLAFTGRPQSHIDIVKAYAKAQMLWHDQKQPDPVYTDTIELSLDNVEACLAGPRRPQDRIVLSKAQASYEDLIAKETSAPSQKAEVTWKDHKFDLKDGDLVLAAITSCTNTSNPSVMLGSGLLARKAREHGLSVKPWVKTSLAPGSKVVTDYLKRSGLLTDLENLGFYLVGYGCTTCIGNSGPLPDPIAQAIDKNNITVAGILSGNRNFEGRIHSQIKLNYLASPLLVVAYALAGTMRINLLKDPLGQDPQGNDIYLRDIWPSQDEIENAVQASLTPEMFKTRYRDVFTGDDAWNQLNDSQGLTYDWDESSSYIKEPPFFESTPPREITPIRKARALAILGDSITTDHISPAGMIGPGVPAGQYLQDQGIHPNDFNSYGSRRGNHEVMMRGTFANIRLQNEMTPENTGGMTRWMPTGEVLPIYDAAMRYKNAEIPLIVIAGKEYGTGSSRDWAAKGTRLLGVRAVIAESFERIHRSNLIGMGVLPLCFQNPDSRVQLQLTGHETFTLHVTEDRLEHNCVIPLEIDFPNGDKKIVSLRSRLDTKDEVAYFKHGGILQYVLQNLLKGD